MKLKLFIFFILFFSFLFTIYSSEEKKIRVIVEGEEDTNTETVKDIIPTTQKGVYILKIKQQIENDAKKLKEIAEHPKIEGEIIDAIISKIIDIENNQQKQIKFIIVLSIVVLLLFILVVLLFIKRK